MQNEVSHQGVVFNCHYTGSIGERRIRQQGCEGTLNRLRTTGYVEFRFTTEQAIGMDREITWVFHALSM